MKAVILDLDGLLVDSEPLHLRVFNATLARYSVHYEIGDEEFGREFVGISQRRNAEYLITRFGLQVAVEMLMREHVEQYMHIIADATNLKLMPGAEELLAYLCANKIEMAVASGSPRDQVDLILNGLDIASYFRTTVTGSDVANLKPAPDAYLSVSRALDIAPIQCLAVEDSAAGVASAKAAGMRVVAVPNRYTRHQKLELADARLENLDQVIHLL